jgi:mRNA-degrading endonuclease RelE of RelBE toxin-antitoxin system
MGQGSRDIGANTQGNRKRQKIKKEIRKRLPRRSTFCDRSICYRESFLRSLTGLDSHLREKVYKALKIFEKDPFDSHLKTSKYKHIPPAKNSYRSRIPQSSWRFQWHFGLERVILVGLFRRDNKRKN